MSHSQQAIEYQFIEACSKLDSGDSAQLKRNAGNSIAESHNALGIFYSKLLRYITVPEWDEARFFLVATLYPFERPSKKTDAEPAVVTNRPHNFGASLKAARTKDNQEGLDKRFERFLDADAQQLPFYLRREVRFIINEGKKINWEQLLKDLRHWDHAERFVQRAWARAYFNTPPENNQSS
jgi:CRISPR system Cascade subunit CasB